MTSEAAAATSAVERAVVGGKQQVTRVQLAARFDDLQQLGSALTPPEAVVETSHAAQRRLVGRWTLSHGDECQVGEHEADGPVDDGRAALAPSGESLRYTRSLPAQMARLLDPPPRLVRIRLDCTSLPHDLALRLGPLQAAASLQLLDQTLVQLEEVGHVGSGVFIRPLREGPRHPVSQTIGLREADAQLALHQGAQARSAVADEACCHLGVEQAGRDGFTFVAQYLQVLHGGVHHAKSVTLEHTAQWPDVNGERVDQGDAAAPGQLHQSQVGMERAFAVELRVEPVHRRVDEVVDDRGEPIRFANPTMDGRPRPRQLSHAIGPDSIGSPASIHARVPPATFTASMPAAR